ncbi:MAG TPA: PQQ-dependent sugar dehydrogenase [Solirubrobacteraceae bacterium]|jgi:glucose/arabinose dehydrogenase
MLRRALAVAFLATLLLAPPASAIDFVDEDFAAGFEEVVVAEGLNEPTGMAYGPGGRLYVAEREGRVRVVEPDGTLAPDPVVDISDHVNSYSERGLLGIAVDNDFASHPFLYLLYTYEHDGEDPLAAKTSRLTRVRLDELNPSVAYAPFEETVLIGDDDDDGDELCDIGEVCIPADDEYHSIGTVRQGPDGTLYAGSGDSNATGDFWAQSDAMRPFDPQSLAGKIMRVDRDGDPVEPSFCTDPAQPCSHVFAMGFRNPYRFSVRGNADLIVGDVGSSQYEEVNRVLPGRDHGWPCWEGYGWTAIYQGREECQERYALTPPPSNLTSPWIVYGGSRAVGQGAAVYAGPTYTGATFPPKFAAQQRFFYGDTVRGWLNTAYFDGGAVRTKSFATGVNYAVEMIQSPEGDVVYSEYGGAIKRIRFACAPDGTACNKTPIARLSAIPDHGEDVDEITFSAAGSSDPDGDALTYSWDFDGDGDFELTGPDATPPPQSFAPGRYVPRVVVGDGSRTAVAQQVVFPGYDPPSVTIDPVDEEFRAGESVDVSGSASDPNTPAQALDPLVWKVTLLHNDHVHPRGRWVGPTATFKTLDSHDADSGYLVELTARNAIGMTATKSVQLHPKTVKVTLASDPPGARLLYGAREGWAPFTIDAAVNYTTPLTADYSVYYEGEWLPFSHWEHTPSQQFSNVKVPDHDVTYTAVYGPRSTKERPPGELAPPLEPPGPPIGPFQPPRGPRGTLGAFRGRRVSGTATAPLGVRRVRIALARRAGRRCRLLRAGRFTKPTRCSRRTWTKARLGRGKATRAWSLTLRKPLRPGRYTIVVRVEDMAGATANRSFARRLTR